MKHTVTITHLVEANSWDEAVGLVLQDPITHVIDCRVKSPGKQLIRVIVSVLKEVHARLYATTGS
jgi:hypothetical protein